MLTIDGTRAGARHLRAAAVRRAHAGPAAARIGCTASVMLETCDRCILSAGRDRGAASRSARGSARRGRNMIWLRPADGAAGADGIYIFHGGGD